MRLPIRICRRTGILGGTKDGPLMKNAVPFYRSRSAILHTVYGAYTALVPLQAGGGRSRGSGSGSGLRRQNWAYPAVAKAWMSNRTACADDDHKLAAAGFRTLFFLDSDSIVALNRRT